MNTIQQCVLTALDHVIACPEHDESRIAELFSPQYRQYVDGKWLEYDAFVRHLSLLKQISRRMTLVMEAIANHENIVLTHHWVDVEKTDGTSSTFEVFAQFRVVEERIIECKEITRLAKGDAQDRGLGSAIVRSDSM